MLSSNDTDLYTLSVQFLLWRSTHLSEIKDCGTQRGRLALTADWLIGVCDPSLNYTVSTIEPWFIA